MSSFLFITLYCTIRSKFCRRKKIGIHPTEHTFRGGIAGLSWYDPSQTGKRSEALFNVLRHFYILGYSNSIKYIKSLKSHFTAFYGYIHIPVFMHKGCINIKIYTCRGWDILPDTEGCTPSQPARLPADHTLLYRDILYRDKQRKTLLYCGVSWCTGYTGSIWVLYALIYRI